jgi:D-glycero-D-manno-heptose 1,7-bisphosphate phosphatase
VFLDRDGVLVRSDVVDGKPYAVRSLDDFEIIADAPRATKALREAGFFLVVVTNQPDVGNGIVAREVVEEMNRRLRTELGLDAVKTCFHAQTAGCACRKPSPALLVEAAREFGLDLAASYMVGDRSSDIACGAAAGCTTLFIERHYREPLSAHPHAIVSSTTDAAALIVRHAEDLRS